jgi:site-specific DNA recombinase
MPPRRPAKRENINDLRDLRVGLYCRVSLDKDEREKSVDDQEAIGREWVRQQGAILAGIYKERRSASRFATKERGEFKRLLADIEAGALDVVWFWEFSRSQRDLAVFVPLRKLCRDLGVILAVGSRPYDPNDYKDMLPLGILSIVGEIESEQTSERVQRGKQSSAHAGRPAGKVPYGYKRIWNKDTGAWERDVPNVFDGDGRLVEDSPAYVVREIFERIAAGDSITGIRKDLNDRRVRTQQGYAWDNSKVRYIAMSPTYIGQRIYQAEQHCEIRAGDRSKAVLKGVRAGWPPLVDEATFWTVQRILTDPARRTTRLGARTGKYLLSSLALCAECDGKLIWKQAPADHRRSQFKDIYYCKDHACVGVPAVELDAYVERVIVKWLADPNTAADLAADGDSAAAAQARADAARARVELGQLYADVKAGTVSATIATMEETRLLEAVAEAEQREKAATLPAVLAGNIGPQAKGGWDALDLAGKRLIIRTVAEIRVCRVGRGRKVHPAARVKGRWLLGDGADWPAFDPDSSGD